MHSYEEVEVWTCNIYKFASRANCKYKWLTGETMDAGRQGREKCYEVGGANWQEGAVA